MTGSRARDAVFAPLDPTGRAEAVARRLADAILSGLLRDGEGLPRESDLAASFGVSTVTVREALVELRRHGLVETRRGRGGGSFVRSPDLRSGLVRARLESTSLAELRELCDHYAAITATAALLAADRAGDDDLARIRTGADAFAAAPDAGSRRRTEGTVHIEVAAASQSARLTREEIALQSEVGPLLWLPYSSDAAHRRAVEQHEAILAAIAAGDTTAAHRLTREHVHEALARLTEEYLATVR